MEEVEDYRQWLDGWVGPDGDRPPFGEIDLSPEERLPRGALDDAEPDEQHVEEATGNAGATIERTYRRAALWCCGRRRGRWASLRPAGSTPPRRLGGGGTRPQRRRPGRAYPDAHGGADRHLAGRPR